MRLAYLTGLVLIGMSAAAQAQFGIVVPSADVVEDRAGRSVTLSVAFAHPMERTGMTMEKPEAFTVTAGGKTTDLLARLTPDTFYGRPSWKAVFEVARPGVYRFALTPKPYWEPAEDKFIIHYTQTVLPAYGDEDGWDEPLGLKTEIVPLTRPFGNWAGNTFRGRVLADGKPVPHAEVEVEYLNRDGERKPASGYHVTQVVRADEDGIFVYTAPWAGWWGFAALTEADFKIRHEGADRDVELGAVFWTYFSK